MGSAIYRVIQFKMIDEKKIVAEIKRGASYAVLAAKYQCTKQRISQLALKNGIRKMSYMSRPKLNKKSN